MSHENINGDQIRWDFFKYRLRKFSRIFSKTLGKDLGEELGIHKSKLKLHEQNLKCFENEDYLRCKLRLKKICELGRNYVKIRSKCDWYEYGENYSKFFLNVEKIVLFWVKIVN